MAPTYRIQRGTLSGGYKTTYQTGSRSAAWVAYFKTRLDAGLKKRIQEIGTEKPKTLKSERQYWT